jgi:hypothetical protein
VPDSVPEPGPSAEELPELLDEHIVVRGGEMRQRDLERSVEVHFERHGVWALSLWSFPDMDAQQIASEVGVVARELGIRLLPNPMLRWTTAGDLRALGYSLEPGGGPRGHVTLTFSGAPSEEDWRNLEQAFSRPERNPIAKASTP